MSDFDHFFSDKLKEETQFAGQGKNWKALSGRLDAFGLGTTAATAALRYWQWAAAGLTLATGLLIWKTYTVSVENQALHKTIRELQIRQAPGVPVANLPSESATPSVVAGAAGRAPEKTKTREAAPALPGFPSPLVFWKFTPPEVSQQPTLPAKENILKKDLIDNAPAASGQEPLAPESRIPIANAIASAGAPETPGMAANFSILRSLALRELPQSVPGTLRPAAEPAPVAAPIIRPHRERKSRFRAGVQASVAAPAPAEQGVSWLRGAGISAEYTPVRNLWLTAASDWMSFDIHRSKNITEPFFPGKPPKPKGHHNELVAVVAHPRQQQISLGIRYALPLRFWVRPSVRIAHNWLLEDPGVFSFGFEDKDPGHPTPAPPELIASRPGSRLVQNIWRFGAALERETPFWVFRAGVDWVDASAASEPAFHSVVLYTGIQYKL